VHEHKSSYLILKRRAKALVPGHQISWMRLSEYAIFLHGLTEQWRPQKKQHLAQR